MLHPSNRKDLRGILAERLEQRSFHIGAQKADVLQGAVVEIGEPENLAPVPQRAPEACGPIEKTGRWGAGARLGASR